MKSNKPKVLHEIARLPMISHVVQAMIDCGVNDLAVVTGQDSDLIRKAVLDFAPKAHFFIQDKPLGTAHAVLAAGEAFLRGYDDILIVYGDTPLVPAYLLSSLLQEKAKGHSLVVTGFVPSNPCGYGRIIQTQGFVSSIREERNCSGEEKKIPLCNAGLMAIEGKALAQLVHKISPRDCTGEFYLTEIVEMAFNNGLSVGLVETHPEFVAGVNTQEDLASAETLWQKTRRCELMLSGVTLVSPETVFLSYDTQIGSDTIIEPFVSFGPGVKIGSCVKIKGFSYIEGACISEGCEIGPYARLRTGTQLEKNVKIGNFVETKEAVVEEGSKINHLAYVGDARLGSYANIGAGSIFCNYDGNVKSFTDIGAGAFIGSNSSLVAPLSIGRGAYVASGSVVTENVPDNSLVFGRARQTTLPGRALHRHKNSKN